ncbi:MAG: hypothetical protein ACI9TY_000865 [Alphaproteobacteria bacterium]|jgi:hypothetical protein
MKKPKRLRNHALIVKSAAWSYVLLALLYPIFTLSSLGVDLPSNGIESFLKNMIAGGSSDHVFWTLFSIIPLLLVFGGVGFYSAVKPYSFKLSGLALFFSALAAIGFLLGIGRWATLNWGLGEAFVAYKSNSAFITNAYQVSNEILGYWVGHVFAEISLFVAIGVMSIAIFNSKRFPLWLSGFAGVLFIIGVAAVFRDTNEASLWLHNGISTFMLVPLFFLFLAVALFRFVGKSKEKKVGRGYAKKDNGKANGKKRRFYKRKDKKSKKEKQNP